jgi:flagellar export protein FliJ
MAKRFVFRLETVRRVRELREREAQRAAAGVRAQIAQFEQQNAQAQREIVNVQQRLTHQQALSSIDPTELSRGRSWIAHLRITILQRERQIDELGTKLEELLDVWREARKQLEIINKLRERRLNLHRTMVRKHEQREMDAVAQRLHTLPQILSPGN